MNLETQLRNVTQALAAAGVEYALIGGLALAVYGWPRATRDIDLLVSASDWEAIRAALGPLGFRHPTTPIRMAGGELEFRHLTQLDGREYLVADFLIPSDALAAKLGARRSVSWNGVPLTVADPEILIALKRLRNSPQDRADIAVLEELAQ